VSCEIICDINNKPTPRRGGIAGWMSVAPTTDTTIPSLKDHRTPARDVAGLAVVVAAGGGGGVLRKGLAADSAAHRRAPLEYFRTAESNWTPKNATLITTSVSSNDIGSHG